jgi:acetyl-CoA acetyltransferase
MNPPNTPQVGFCVHMASRLGLKCSGQLSEVMNLGISGGLAFDQAMADIEAGRADYAVVAGVLYQSAIKGHVGMEQGIRSVGDVEFQSPFGFTPISWYALDAARYIHEFGVSEEEISMVSVKSRAWSSLNPIAQFPETLTLAEAMSADMIVDPLRLFDVPQRADGAICFILCADHLAKEHRADHVFVKSRGFHHDGQQQIGDTPHDMIEFSSALTALDRALDKAHIGISDLDIYELYAPCSITELLVAEAIALFKRGQAGAATHEGRTAPGGDVPLNTSGGCLGRGHPPALTGLYGIYELWEQLRGAAHERQIPDARLGLNMCELGNYNAALVHVLEAAQ